MNPYVAGDDDNDDDDCNRPFDDHDIHIQAAAYVLGLKYRFGISQVAIDHILCSTKHLITEIFCTFINNVSADISQDTLEYLKNQGLQVAEDLFTDLNTRHLQQKYIENNLNHVVSY